MPGGCRAHTAASRGGGDQLPALATELTAPPGSRFKLQPCPICLGDARDPVCLPCEHVFCLPCLRTWLAPSQRLCPYCLTDLPDNFTPTVSQEHKYGPCRPHLSFPPPGLRRVSGTRRKSTAKADVNPGPPACPTEGAAWPGCPWLCGSAQFSLPRGPEAAQPARLHVTPRAEPWGPGVQFQRLEWGCSGQPWPRREPDGACPPPARRMAISRHAQFRQLCDTFFVDLVSSMCFRDNCPPHRDVVQGLLSLLFARKEVLRDAVDGELPPPPPPPLHSKP